MRLPNIIVLRKSLDMGNKHYIITYSANLTNSDTHVSFNKIISLQDKFTFKPNVTRKKRKCIKCCLNVSWTPFTPHQQLTWSLLSVLETSIIQEKTFIQDIFGKIN